MLLILQISFNFYSNVYYKSIEFFKTLLKKSYKLIANKQKNTIALSSSFVLLLAEVDFLLQKKKIAKKMHL